MAQQNFLADSIDLKFSGTDNCFTVWMLSQEIFMLYLCTVEPLLRTLSYKGPLQSFLNHTISLHWEKPEALFESISHSLMDFDDLFCLFNHCFFGYSCIHAFVVPIPCLLSKAMFRRFSGC